MAKCWTCGSLVDSPKYTCASCEGLTQVKQLREDLEAGTEGVFESLESLAADVQQLRRDVSEGMAAIASAIEWGFEELSWQLEQQTAVLKSIDHRLKTPAQTQASELRAIGEGLRARGVLDEAERRFLQALDLNPLDYRTYVSLAHTYLRSGGFDEARSALEKSLPHAPRGRKQATALPASPRSVSEKEEEALLEDLQQGSEEQEEAVERMRLLDQVRIRARRGRRDAAFGLDTETTRQEEERAGMLFDWKSYSYRVIGRIHACGDDYGNAVVCLRSSIGLSPEYAEGHYDYAQYCAQTGNAEACLVSLRKAALAKPRYWYLAHHERNFDPLRGEVERLLVEISTDARRRAQRAISDAETAIGEAREAVSEAEQALRASREKGTLDSSKRCEEATATLELARSKVASADYMALLHAEPAARQARAHAGHALSMAKKEREHYRRRKRENVRRAWGRVPGALYGYPQVFGLIGLILGGVVGALIGAVIQSREALEIGAGIGALAGILAGLAHGIENIWNELHGKRDG